MLASTLNVQIFENGQKLKFFGAGTYNFREQIKSAGIAKWLPLEKAWEVKNHNLDINKLKAVFPGINIVGDATDSENSEEVVPAEAISSTEPKRHSVVELLGSVQSAIQSLFPQEILVYGVIRSLKRSVGRVYIDLSEEQNTDTTLSCVIWRGEKQLTSTLREAGFELGENLLVLFKGRIDLNPRNGRVNFSVTGIIAEFTLAKLKAEREKTNERLRKEGIFERNKQLPFPFFPSRIGILTSKSGTVIHDFLLPIEESSFGFKLFWYPVAVQGSDAKDSIIKGLRYFAKRSDIDLVLVFRGGGSVGDLAVFNNYEVAKEIALFPIPILSAIGHEEDRSSTQDVSFKSFSVPRDLGNFLASLVVEFRRRIDEALGEIVEGADRVLEIKELELNSIRASLLRRGELILQQSEFGVNNFIKLLPERARTFLKEAEMNLQILAGRIEEASPEKQLQRGFALVREHDRFITRASQIKSGDQLELDFADETRSVKAL